MNLTDYESLHPHVTVDGITFLTPNTHCAWRVDTLYTKEPDTIAWIKAMPKDAVLYDIGANMGQYSMLAAKRGITVHAFEPESQNFALMCRNLGINKFGGKITPWPIALSDEEGLDDFYVTSIMPGGSCHSFGESVDYHLRPKNNFKFKQGCYATTLDKFTLTYGVPTHIKLDVDGLEHKVLNGGYSVLLDVKSVLVELNTALPEHMAIYDLMEANGLYPDVATADAARRKEGPFKGIGNVIFYRDKP